ncbi:hypothetical protein GQ54DRAFT_261879 [Martensiomyces pterosporus]|nr:hypothetical protein GQ54DRAFT_261879 [Martensiomyces pterosporus]
MEKVSDKRDIAVVGACSGMLFASFLVLVYINLNRTYTPLKCKNIPLINVLFASISIWFIGDVYVDHPSLVHATRPICIATISWLRMSLGMYCVVCCYTFRIYEYICIFQWRIRATGRHLWVPLALWALVPLAYGVLASALPPSSGIEYVEDTMICRASKPIYFIAVAALIVLALVCGYATFAARHLNACFNEFRELLPMVFVTLTVCVVQVTFRWIPDIGGNVFTYNTLVTITDFIVGQVSFYALVTKPVYHCAVDRDEYLKYFLRKLKRENLEEEYEIANGQEMDHVSTSLTSTAGNQSWGRFDEKMDVDSTNLPYFTRYMNDSEPMIHEPSMAYTRRQLV